MLTLVNGSTALRKWPLCTPGSRKILLILAWVFVVDFSQSLNDNTDPLSYYGKGTVSQLLEKFNDVVCLIAFVISCPVANLMAEVVAGRYKVHQFKYMSTVVSSYC